MEFEKRLRRLERRFFIALLALFLCIQWGPLGDERSDWGIARGHPFVREVALTFDDGPMARGMPELLAALESIDARATFFLVGKMVERHGSITQSIHAAGHDIENHSFTHPNFQRLSLEEIMFETQQFNDAVEALGIPRPFFLRPPGGGFNLDVFHAMRRMNLRLGLWSVNTADYTGRPAHEIVNLVVRSSRPGSVILLHSGVPATIEALPAIADGLRERGFRFVTLRDMFNRGAI